MYSSNKRKKELARKKKQDEKRTKRQKDDMDTPTPIAPEGIDSNVDDSASSDNIPEPSSD